jgi:hypothetical protein
MAELWVNDAGTARQIRDIWVNDSGTARQIREIWVNDSGTARRVFSRGILFTFTAGSGDLQGTSTPIAGYGDDVVPLLDGSAMGSITSGSATNHDGKVASALFTETTPNTTRLYIRGHATNPGSGYLTSLVINGITIASGSISYTYASGQQAGVWSFTLPATVEAGNEFVPGNSYTVEVTTT